jgi:signal transduction histidine kinase
MKKTLLSPPSPYTEREGMGVGEVCFKESAMPSHKVLIVDDEPRNLLILEGVLAPLQYDLRQAKDGSEALDQVAADPPDLVLLDVMMPGLSGFDVCRRLKSRPDTQFIPIVLVTALTDRDSRVTGIEAGADDFISKPVDAHELRARVRSLLRIKSLHDEKERAQQQLIQAERLAAVGELVAGSAHELNNPLAVASSLMQSAVEMLQEDTPEELAQDRATLVQNLQMGLKDLNRAKDIVASLLSLSEQTGDYTEPVQVNIVADDALRMLRGRYDKDRVRVVREYGEDLPTVTGSFADLGQMAMHLVRNAMEAIRGSGTITLRTAMEDDRVVFECRDTGKGIPAEIRGDIFKPFFKTKPPAEGTGLGLYICHQIVKKHGGTISVESEVGKGSTFRVRLPCNR